MKPEFREKLAQLSFEEKIRKVGELIALSRDVKRSTNNGLLAQLDKAAAELDSGKGVPIMRVRDDIRKWAKKSNK